MQDRPTAAELLADVAALLDDEVLPTLDGGVKHHVRVAANLCRIVEREVRLGPGLAAEEEELLRGLLPDAPPDDDVPALHQRLVAAIRAGDVADEAARTVLLTIARGKLAVTKPGYGDFDFASEVRR